MIRIIGIDPGSRYTGYGIIDSDGRNSRYVTSGYISVKGESLADKLGDIFGRINDIIVEWRPQEFSIEQVFVNRNADSALKLGQARGAAICAAIQNSLSVSEYTPRTVKNAVVGSGAASKEQVQHMMRVLLKLGETLQADEADALGVALCHAHHRNLAIQLPQVSSRKRSWRRR